jgi:hypothetical protein
MSVTLHLHWPASVDQDQEAPPREWQSVKANIIRNYATVRAYAARLGCHYNSIRNAVAYQGGAIHAQMQKDGLL